MLHRGTDTVWYEIGPDGITTFAVAGGNHEGRRIFENHMTLEQFGALAAAVEDVVDAAIAATRLREPVVAIEQLPEADLSAMTKRLEALEAMSDEKLEQKAAKMGIRIDKALEGDRRRLALIMLINRESPEDSPEVEEPEEEFDPESGGEEVTVEAEGTTSPPDAREPEPTEDLPAGDAFGESVQAEPAGGPPSESSAAETKESPDTDQKSEREAAHGSAADDKAQAAADIAAAKPEPEFSTHDHDSEHPQ